MHPYDEELTAFMEAHCDPLAGIAPDLWPAVLARLGNLPDDAETCRRLGSALARACENEALLLEAAAQWQAAQTSPTPTH